MHFLDDTAAMDATLRDHSLEWACLCKLLTNGGSGYLRSTELAKALHSSSAFVSHAVKRLESSGKIEAIDKKAQLYRIKNWFDSKYAFAVVPELEVSVVGLEGARPALAGEARLSLAKPQASDAAHAILKAYHSHVRLGGPLFEAVERINELLEAGWKPEQLVAAIKAYAITPGDMKRAAFTFFEHDGRHFWGEQWLQRVEESAARPKVAAEIADFQEMLRKKKEAGHA